MTHWYNENDAYAAVWLANLQAAEHLAPGKIDQRSIVDVEAKDLDGVRQAHFFAGIGGWPLALQLAGWPNSEEVWTGSCPCQPFSITGKGRAERDSRHLWPKWLPLIAQRRPAVIFGEQVASPLGRQWLSGVRADLENLGYAVGCADLCAAGVTAPHIRQRLWWVAYRLESEERGERHNRDPKRDGQSRQAEGADPSGWMVDGLKPGLEGHSRNGNNRNESGRIQKKETRSTTAAGGASYWGRFDLVACRDGKERRIEPGSFPMAHGVPARVGKLRAYGNAIVPQIAAEFVKAFLETREQ